MVPDEDGNPTFHCEALISQIGENVKNSKHYQYFMENSTYTCVAKALGCDAILSGKDIKEHELETCKYR